MTTVLLVRHAPTSATGHVLSGWTPGMHLNDRGRGLADALANRLRPLHLDAIVSSPLERCVETAGAIALGRPLSPVLDDRLGECRYGDWTGQDLRVLAKDPLWKVVQAHPSGVTFPGGEALRDVQARAVGAIRDWNDRLGSRATYLACSHADVIKTIVADALGLHLDQFQRISISPASLTVIDYGSLRPTVLRLNDVGAPVDELQPARRTARARRVASPPA
jgi:probable phosphoglycerate mutase